MSEQSQDKKKLSGRRLLIVRIVVLVFVVVLTVYLLSIREKIQEFQQYGYPGLFLVSLLSSATVLIPVPGVLVTSAFGAIFNPIWVAVVSGLGAGLGELSGYLAGFSGQAVVEKAEKYNKLERWMAKYGDITVFVLAIIPNPLFDMAGLTAGALRLPVWRFLIWCILGKIIKMLAFAYGGAAIVDWFAGL